MSQTLHVRVAADNLYLTQAAVSSRIKQLEEELGVQLFDRTQKRLKAYRRRLSALLNMPMKC